MLIKDNEIRWDGEKDNGLTLKDKFENVARLIEEKMNGRSGYVLMSEHNYSLFAASTTGYFNLEPRIKFKDRYWDIIINPMLKKDEIRVFTFDHVYVTKINQSGNVTWRDFHEQ